MSGPIPAMPAIDQARTALDRLASDWTRIINRRTEEARQQDQRIIELQSKVRDLTTQRDGLRDGIDTIAGLINRQLSDEAGDKRGLVYAHDLIAVLESIPGAGHSKDNESEDR